MNIKEYVYNSSPQTFNPDLASLIGLHEAIIFQQIIYWCKRNAEANRNFHDGHYWCYNSYKDWQSGNFKYLSESTIKRVITNLEKLGLLISGNYNSLKIDKTKWYRPNMEYVFDQPTGQIDPTIGSKTTHPAGQIEPSNTRDYTETNSETTHKNTISDEIVRTTKKTKSPEQQQKDDRLKSDYQTVINTIVKNNYPINPDQKLSGYIYNTLKREGVDRTVRAVNNIFQDDWQKANGYPGLTLMFIKADKFTRYANIKSEKANFDDIAERVKKNKIEDEERQKSGVKQDIPIISF